MWVVREEMPGLPYSTKERKKRMELSANARQKVLLCMTMMEAAALDLLDTIAIERAALQEMTQEEGDNIPQ